MRRRNRSLPLALVGASVIGLGLTAAGAASSATADTANPSSLQESVKPRPARRTIPRSAVSAPETTTSTTQAIRFAPNNAWTIRADQATTLADDSDVQVNNLVAQVRDSVGERAHINTIDHATTIVTVPAGTRRVTLGLNAHCANKDDYMEYYRGEKVFVDVPIPDGMVAPSGVDKELTIYDPTADQLWDFWDVERTGSGWAACAGGRIDKVSTNRGYFRPTYGASASGLAIAGGSITLEEMRRGSIDHAIVLNIRQTAGWQNPTWPAQFGDGKSGPAARGDLRQGQRLRLDPSVDVEALGLNRMGTMIARAAQKYGFIVCDTSGTVNIPTESGRALLTTTGKNPWDEFLGGNEWDVLPSFPWNRLQALPLAYGK